MPQLIYLSMAKSLADYAKFEFPFATVDKPYVNCQEYYKGIADACDFIKDGLYGMKPVDAVPVVRCKDCKYYKPDEYECGCDCPAGLPYVKADDFCSYGERRDQSADVRKMDADHAPESQD